MCQFLTLEQVIQLHAGEVSPGLLADPGLLASGVARPQQTVGGEDAYPTLHAKAAALLHSLATTQPFVDGNKRVALLALRAFLNLNGWDFRPELQHNQGELVHFVEDIAQGLLDVPKIAEQLSRYTEKITFGGLDLS